MGIKQSDLKRYTELPFVLQMLRDRELPLLTSSAWDDKNDAMFVNVYEKKSHRGSVLALCLTGEEQTYHHWKVFTHGSSGACICFDTKRFQQWASTIPDLRAEYVEYKTLVDLKRNPPKITKLPFIKRRAYQHEKEYRLIFVSEKTGLKVQQLSFPLDLVTGVVINPWLPNDVVDTLKQTIHAIKDCEHLEVIRSTITNSRDWCDIALSAD
jgi:hypothetical protein